MPGLSFQIYGAGERWSDELLRRMRTGLLAVGRYWHQVYLKRHFRLGAFLEYGGVYQARSLKWTRRKLKKGIVSPLIWKGVLYRTLQGGARIVGTERGVSVEMSGPSWLKGYMSMTKGRGGPDIVREIEAVSMRERDEMGELLGRHLREGGVMI